LEKFTLCERKAEDFVTECTDATEVTYSFETEPDLTKVGTQTVTIIGTDAGGNKYSAQAQLTLAEDTEAPTIKGEANVLVYVGDSVSYKAQVKAQDNCPEGLNLEVDASAVNLNEAGTYSVIYTATDCAGNAATFTMNLTVHERQYTLEEANALADKILGKIITDDMTLYDKALAIFNYVKGHIGYVSYSEKGDYVKSAYEGLMSGKGDCYNYASASKLLLDRAGIPNMDIERIPSGNSMHYWNLVDIGDGHGWYHFDTTPRKDRPTIFLWNDAQIKEYSDKHNNCHNYDRELYPVIN